MSTIAQDAELRSQIKASCQVVMRHLEGIVQDTKNIVTMPTYKTECESTINEAERTIALAQQAISAVKTEMGKKQLERT